MREINQAGLDLIRSFEGLRLKSYKDSVGVWTIGYGHTRGVAAGQTCTLDQAMDWLRRDLIDAEKAVASMVTHPITDNQFAALCSFAFNLGSGSLLKSTLLKKVNEGRFEEAAKWFAPWNKAGGVVVGGLTSRRAAEAKLFLTPDGAH